ncbi:MAG: DUF1043 family protein [Mariprofundus sp.]|nr:DUF1043 family protein [Mariprofundus sp.]
MEITSLTGIIIMISIAITAFLIGYLISGRRKGNKHLETELAASREELNKYRSEVTNHFQQTAFKVNALTENCRNVYEHLAQGAQELCNNDDTPKLMDELNRSPILDEETTRSKPDVVSDEADAYSDSKAEPKKNNESPDNTTDAHSVEDKDTTTGAEPDLVSNASGDLEAGENSNRDSTIDAYKNTKDESSKTAEKKSSH